MKRDAFLDDTTAMVQATSKSQPGDMDYLERYAEKPMPAAFEQIDRTCKTMYSFFGLPLPIV